MNRISLRMDEESGKEIKVRSTLVTKEYDLYKRNQTK